MRNWTHRWTWGVCQHQTGAAAGGEGQTGKSSAAAWRGATQRPDSPPTAGGVHQRVVGYWSSAVSVGKWVSDGFRRRQHTFQIPHSEKGLLEVHQVYFGLREVSVFAAQLKHPQHQQQGAVLRQMRQHRFNPRNLVTKQNIPPNCPGKWARGSWENHHHGNSTDYENESLSPFGRVQSLEGGAGRSPAPAASAIWWTGRGVSSDDALGLRPGGRWLHWQWRHQPMSKPTHTGKLEAPPPVNQKSHWCFSLQMN